MCGREEMIKPNICEPTEVIDYVNQFKSVMEKMEARIKELEAALAKPTTIMSGNVTVVYSMPGTDYGTVLADYAVANMSAGRKVLYVAIENRNDDVAVRLSMAGWDDSSMPEICLINGYSGMPVSEVEERARHAGAEVVIVDRASLLRPDNPYDRHALDELAEIARKNGLSVVTYVQARNCR